jgi:hypothetical protein
MLKTPCERTTHTGHNCNNYNSIRQLAIDSAILLPDRVLERGLLLRKRRDAVRLLVIEPDDGAGNVHSVRLLNGILDLDRRRTFPRGMLDGYVIERRPPEEAARWLAHVWEYGLPETSEDAATQAAASRVEMLPMIRKEVRDT